MRGLGSARASCMLIMAAWLPLMKILVTAETVPHQPDYRPTQDLSSTRNDHHPNPRHQAALKRRTMSIAGTRSRDLLRAPMQTFTTHEQKKGHHQQLQTFTSPGQQHPDHREHPPRERRDAKKKSNDVGLIEVSFTSFVLIIDNVHDVPSLLSSFVEEEMTTLGYQIFQESGEYSERFVDLDLGEVITLSTGSMADFVHDANDAANGNDNEATEGNDENIDEENAARMSKMNENVNQSPFYEEGIETETRQDDSNGQNNRHDRLRTRQRTLVDDASDTLMLLLGQNGTISFKGSYYLEDPMPEEVTATLVEGFSDVKKKTELLDKLQSWNEGAFGSLVVDDLRVELWVPVDGMEGAEVAVEDSEEVVAENNLSGDRDGALQEVEDEDVDFVVDELKESSSNGSDEEDKASPTHHDSNHYSDEAENTASAIDSSQDATLTVDRSIAMEEESSASNNSGDSAKVIVPVMLALVAFATVAFGIVYRKRRQRQQNNSKDHFQHQQASHYPHLHDDAIQDDLTNPSGDEGFDDTLNIPTKNIRPRAVSSATNAATGAAGTPAATTPASKNIDKLLADLSDGDSSFISSEPSEATNSVVSGFSGFSGLTSFFGEGSSSHECQDHHTAAALRSGRNSGAFALEDVAHTSSRLSQFSSDDTVESSEIGGNGSGSPDGSGGKGRTGGGGSYLPNNLRKPESFEGYRSMSAMAQLSLRKDILHVLGEAADSTDSGVCNGNNIVTSAGGASRTMSPQKSGSIMEHQRKKDKKEYMERHGIQPRRDSQGEVDRTTGGNDDDGGGDDEDVALEEGRLKRSNFDALEPPSNRTREDLEEVQSLDSSVEVMSTVPIHRNGPSLA